MKYVVFAVALLGILPAAAWCAVNRRFFRLMPVFLMIPVLVFQKTSINPISFEWYRGSSRGYEISAFYLMAIAMLVAIAMRGRKISFAPDWGAKLYLLYFLWSCLSMQNVESAVVGGAELLKMVMMYIVFLAVYNWLCVVKDPRPVLMGFAIVIICSFLMVVREHLGHIWQVRGPFPHQNSLALYMLMATPVFFAYYLNAANRAHGRWLFGAAFFLGAGCLVRTYSRGAIACYPFALAAVLFLSVRRNFSFRQITRLLPLAALGFLGFLLILPRIIQRFETAPKASGNARIEFARCARNMMKAEPFFGVGINNWGIKVNPPYEYWKGTGLRTRAGAGLNDPNHKDGIVETVYLLVGAECGIPALALMLAWYAYYLVSCLKLSKRLAGSSWFFIPVGLAGSLISVYLQSVLEWVLKQSVNFAEMMVFFAVISFLNRHWKDLKRQELEERGLRLQKMQERKDRMLRELELKKERESAHEE
jgi:hypothetical protein